jgi:hypothetical protein
MTTVNRISPPKPQGRTTNLLKVSVTENDPMMKATATAFGFKLTGASTISGTKPSHIDLKFDGQSISVRISRGDTAKEVFEKIQKAMPRGYSARALSIEKIAPPNYTIGITGPPPSTRVDVAKIPTSISANMASANVDAKFWVNLMPSRTPRPNAIATVGISGTGFADAPPKFTVKSIKVYEKGTNKLVATINNPKLVDSEIRRGQKTQNYRLEVPKKALDLGKQYTFVADTGINGSKPQQVRSEFVGIDKVH